VGKVLEVKAENTAEVWLRVFWLYWPEELPQGRQDYHGSQELVMSNHMEIVDAKTVAGGADILRWDELVEDQDVGQRFWRQFYDVRRKHTNSAGDGSGNDHRGLSEIRRHCVCNGYYNPDRTMLKCPDPNCAIWNHQECLEDAAVRLKQQQHAVDQHAVDQNSSTAVNEETSSSNSAPLPLVESIGSVPSAIEEKQEPEEKKNNFLKSIRQRWLGRSRPSPAPASLLLLSASSPSPAAPHPDQSQIRLKAELNADESAGGGAPAMMTITEQRGLKNGGGGGGGDEEEQVPRVWTETVRCLKCNTTIE
jgi:hypothetical protein